jgi:carboxypeptidase C (cathepsin A)
MARAPSVTSHSITINGRILKYTATAGYLPLKDDSGKPEAYVFFTAYTRDDIERKSLRAVTFVFNGGPGAASVWLHLGAIGPKRALITDEEKAAPPPYRLVPNNETWLDLTDLVFIDPVGTGYSRVSEGVDAKKFYGVKGDVESVGEFIRLYSTKYDRWLSPKFLAGESYGTTRAAGLSGFLQDKMGMYLNGIILISSVLDFQVISFAPGNDLSYVLYLPTYTHAAWYHRKLAPVLQEDLERTRSEVEGFALNEYLPALAKGNSLSEAERNSIIDKLSAYTGLSKAYIRNHDLRIGRDGFTEELLRDEHLRVGTLDSRIKGAYEFRHFMDDPSVFNVAGALVATWNKYARGELKYENDTVYEFLSAKVNESWNWGSAAEGFPYVADTLDRALAKNRSLRILITCGYFDLDTPYFGAKYVANHFDRDPTLLKRVTMAYYDAGHQMYTHAPSLKKLKRDVAAFFESPLHTENEGFR